MLASFKSKIIITLLALAFVLLLINVGVETFDKKDVAVKPQIKPETILTQIVQILDNYNIEQSWRKEIPIRRSKESSLHFVYRVKIPKDLMLPYLIRDIYSRFALMPDAKYLKITSRKEHGKAVLRFYENKKNIFRLDLIPDSKLTRRHTDFAFLVRFKNGFSAEEVKNFLAYRYRLTFLFPPTVTLRELETHILNAGKEFAIVYDDDVEDENYLLEPDYSKVQLRHVVSAIVNDFADAVAFYFAPHCSLARSAVFNFIRDEFNKRKRKLIPLSKLKYLHGNSDAEIISRLKFFRESSIGKGKQRILVDAENFPVIEKYLNDFLKMGDRFVKW